MAKVLLILSLLAICFANLSFCEEDSSEEETTSHAIELTSSNFDEAILKNNHFVMFFAPWCGHCKRLHPLWEELAEMMNVKEDGKVVIAKVDCTQHESLCGKHEVTGYPTLKFFKLGEGDSVKFKGTRDMPAITDFINEQLRALEEEKRAEEEAEEAVQDSEIPSTDAAPKPSVFELTEENFAKHISIGNHFVKFYAPWCSHCQHLAPTWEKLGESLKSDDTVSISKIDCTEYRPICQDFDVKGYPTLLWIENGKKIEKYAGSRDLEGLSTFIKKFLNQQKDQKPEEPQAQDEEAVDTSQPLVLNSNNFDKATQQGVTFVKFYAPWCGHCQQLSPTWDQLAAKLHAANNGVRIAKVDCTESENKNLCVDQQVEGYPTLFAYKEGVKQTEYNGGRSLSELQNYISNILGHTEL